MKKSYCWVLGISLTLSSLVAANNDLIFHFDFKGCQGQKVWKDRTGKFSAQVKTGKFVEQSGALRSAIGAQISIPDPRPPQAVGQLTAMAWILKKSTPEVTPILMKGEHPYDVQFLFSVGWRYPQLAYKNLPRQQGWKGLWYSGYFGSSIHYSNKTWLKPGTHLIESGGYWRHVAATFDHGKVKIYLDGRLAAENQCAKPELLASNSSPFFIAAERTQGENTNSITGDMLLNDLRLYRRALSAAEIRQIQQQELPKYPQGNLIPRGENHLNALAPCYDYLDPQYDPLMKKVLPITQKFLAQRDMSDPFPQGITAKVQKFDGTPGLTLNGQRLPLIMGIPNERDGRTLKFKYHEARMGALNFSAAGINLISTGLRPEIFWRGEGQYDWTITEKLIKDKIQANPHCALMIYIALTPPPWFQLKYPDELEKSYFGNNLRRQTAGPLGSDKWLETKCRMLRDLVNHMEKQDYGRHIYAYLLGGGQSNEWYWPASVYGGIPGYSVATRRSFQAWLRQHYRNDVAALQKSWRNPQLTFDSAQVPSPQFRRQSENGLFRDPVVAAPVMDFRRYMTDQTVRHIKKCTETVKQACGNRKLTVVYSGYDLSVASSKLFHSGLCGAYEVCHLDSVDMLCTPIDYGMRRGGQTGLRVNAFDGSAKLAGKVLWQEDDPRTHLCLFVDNGRSANLKETLEVQNRSLAQALTRGTGCWWLLFDNAWFQQNEILTTLQKNMSIARSALSQPARSVAQAAIIFSEKSHYYLADARSSFLQFHTWETYQAAVKSGAVFDYYYEPDLLNPRMPNYKLYIFLDAYVMDAATRQAIQKKLQRNNALAVWCYAPGYFDGKQASLANMTALTGFNFKCVKDNRTVTIPARKTPQFGFLTEWKFQANPRFYVTDPAVISTADGGVLAIKNMKNWRSIYSLVPLDQYYLRGLCRIAGIHLYADQDDMLLANQSYLMLHTRRAGNKTIKLPGKFNVTELYSNRVVGSNLTQFTELGVPAGVTRLYRLEKAE